MRSVCEDFGMRFVGSYSAHMDDIMREEERQRLVQFAREFFGSIQTRAEFPRVTAGIPTAPLQPFASVSQVIPAPTLDKRIVILTDVMPGQDSLGGMVARLSAAWGGAARVVNLWDLDIKGGCQGCLRCGSSYRCAYTGKDGFIDFYNSVLVPADIIVFAGTIRCRQLSWKWREFFDRSFFNTHTPSLVGKQFAFLVSGPLSMLPEFRETYEAWTELQRSNLAAFLSDESGDTRVLDAALDQMAQRLVRMSESAYIKPRTFLGVAGMKIFRDDIWSELRVVFRADHKAYKKMGYYDFPQRRIGRRVLMGLAWLVTGLPLIRSRFPSMIREQMVVPMRRAALRGAARADHAA
jgi:hypothetical protein